MSETLAFTVFCLESYKEYKNLSGAEVNRLFHQYGVYDYLREFSMFCTPRAISTSITASIYTSPITACGRRWVRGLRARFARVLTR